MLKKSAFILLLPLFASTVNAITINYNYDQIGRLTQATYEDMASINYAYDPAGNLLQSQITAAATEKIDEIGVDISLRFEENRNFLNLKKPAFDDNPKTLLELINEIPALNELAVNLTQNENFNLVFQIKGEDCKLKPTRVEQMSSQDAKLNFTEIGNVALITKGGIKVYTESIHEANLDGLLLEYYDSQEYFKTGNHELFTKPAICKQQTEEQEGIKESIHPTIRNAKLLTHIFKQDGKTYAQDIFADTVDMSALLDHIKQISEKGSVSINLNNEITATIEGQRYKGVLDYRATRREAIEPEQIQFTKGHFDNEIIIDYPNGQYQSLFYERIE